MKKSGFKYQIEQELKKQDWEIVQINSTESWWDDEHWKIQQKNSPDKSFYLCFIADPMFEGNGKKGQRIYEIKFTAKFPENWNDSTHTIASIQMSKGKFDQKLIEFINKLSQFKNTILI
jgi:hypothetical protein